MSRIARVVRPGSLQHVISRFVDRDWYLTSDEERGCYLVLLGRALEHSDWLCVAYCLMSNHLHFALVAGNQPLEWWAKRVNSPFARWLNAQRGRLGPVFADRPATYEVPSQRELEIVSYIHNNPVRAKVVASAEQSSWSSHRAYVGLARRPKWLHVAEGLRRFGLDGQPDAFDEAVRGSAASRYELPNLARARREARKRGQVELGTPRLTVPCEIPVIAAPFARPVPSIESILAVVAERSGVSVDDLQQRHARGPITTAKRLAVHAARRLGMSISTMAAALNVTRQRGSLIARTELTPDERTSLSNIVEGLRGG